MRGRCWRPQPRGRLLLLQRTDPALLPCAVRCCCPQRSSWPTATSRMTRRRLQGRLQWAQSALLVLPQPQLQLRHLAWLLGPSRPRLLQRYPQPRPLRRLRIRRLLLSLPLLQAAPASEPRRRGCSSPPPRALRRLRLPQGPWPPSARHWRRRSSRLLQRALRAEAQAGACRCRSSRSSCRCRRRRSRRRRQLRRQPQVVAAAAAAARIVVRGRSGAGGATRRPRRHRHHPHRHPRLHRQRQAVTARVLLSLAAADGATSTAGTRSAAAPAPASGRSHGAAGRSSSSSSARSRCRLEPHLLPRRGRSSPTHAKQRRRRRSHLHCARQQRRR